MGYAGLRLFSIFAMCAGYFSEAYFFVPQAHLVQGSEGIEISDFVIPESAGYNNFISLDFKGRKYKEEVYFFDRDGIDKGFLKGHGGRFENHYRGCEASFLSAAYLDGFDCSNRRCGGCLIDLSHYDKAYCYYESEVECPIARSAVSYKLGDQLINTKKIKKE